MPTLLDTAEFALAKATLDETLQRIEKARQDRLELVRKYLEMYRAEIARLEATTGADILCEAMDALKAECWGSPGEAVEVQSPKPQPEAQSSASAEEPFIPGLPPEALRKAWPEWESHERTVVRFVGDKCETNNGTEDIGEPYEWNDVKLRPRGATRAHVEALAQQAQTPKPHACPRCDEGMRGVEVVAGPYAESYWLFVDYDDKAETFTVQSFTVQSFTACNKGYIKRFARQDCRFTRPDVSPPSKWCDGSGKAE
jgi:hypothetical protein